MTFMEYKTQLSGVFPSGGTTPEVQRTLRGGPCGVSPCGVRKGYKPPEGSPEGVPFSEASSLPPSKARPSRREGHREVAITKKLKKVPPESPGEPLIFVKNSDWSRGGPGGGLRGELFVCVCGGGGGGWRGGSQSQCPPTQIYLRTSRMLLVAFYRIPNTGRRDGD